MAVVPFRQLPFAEVPDAPRLAHRWADAQRRDVTIHTPELGEVRIVVWEAGRGEPLLLVA